MRSMSLLVLLVACAPSDPSAGVRYVISDRAPAYGEAPFPSDAWINSSGRLEPIAGLAAIAPKNTDLLAAHLQRLDGFGLRPVIEVFIEGDGIDPESLPLETSRVSDAIYLQAADGSVVPYQWRWDASRRAIAGSPRPGESLAEGASYTLVVTEQIHAADGNPLQRSWSMLLDAEPPPRWRSTRDAMVSLEDRSEVVAVSRFTTQHATRSLIAARTVLENAPLPELSFPDPALIFDTEPKLQALLGRAQRRSNGLEIWGWSSTTGVARDHVGLIATGRITTLRFRRDDTRDDGPDDETFAYDASGAPIAAATDHVPITFVLPKTPAPADGYPLVIVGHGMGSNRHAVLTFAEPLTSAGFAIVAIDMHGHGSRLDPSDRKNNTADICTSFSGDATLRDGFADVGNARTVLDLFEGFLNLGAVRDSVRQSALSLGSVARLLKQGDLDLSPLAGPYGAAPKLDRRRIAYLGESFGSVVGAVFAGIEPHVDLFVLDVAGGGVIDLAITRSPGLRQMIVALAREVYGLEGRVDRFHPMIALGQALVDGADPISFASHFADRERSVVLIEVINDELIANVASEALARAAKIPLVEPSVGSSVELARVSSPYRGASITSAMVQSSPATHGANWTSESGTLRFYPLGEDEDEPRPLPSPIEVANPLYETWDQVLHILRTHLTGAPEIKVTLPPVRDFDGDGMSDQDERAAGRDPYQP